ncbi:YceD family protein [Ligilactobacillus saerimneri]|uniref:YceD family protein n=1 Tax=Ligilactobacillus saerimneri TaxID=228229 RepID=UPI001C106806|nr:YceD family protein [Ligilactobacillus saerimneri]MBU5308933.1 DUF177 domain-containing protein [Ligilactobacillus saerimneri]
MKWSLNELRRTGAEPLSFKETIDLTEQLKAKRADIQDVSAVTVDGFFTNDRFGIVVYAKVEVSLVVPSTRSLTLVTLNLSFDFTEHYLSKFEKQKVDEFEGDDVVIVLDDDYVDLQPVICDNILLQIPMQVLTVAEAEGVAQLEQGEGWQVEVEDQTDTQKKKDQIDPRLAKLKDFFATTDD